jgi:predicted TIM-barrel fold metal-dependent hydrolase
MTMDRRTFLGNSSLLLSAAALGTAPVEAGQQPMTPNRKHRLVATEEAFATPEQVEAFRKCKDTLWHDPDVDLWNVFLTSETLMRRLLDVDHERISIMDQAGVDMHVLSLTSPGVQLLNADTATSLAALANDQLAEMVKRHPTRYAGLASFAPQDPARAAKEIDRAINKLHLNGLIVNSHTNGEYLDNPKFWPIFEAATACNAAIYVHPRNPPAAAAELLRADVNLWAAIWGYQQETGLHAMRLIVGRVFDEFPKLKIVLGHMGEALPYWLYRIDYMYKNATLIYNNVSGHRLKKLPSEYVKDNFLITTSGMNTHPVLQYCHSVLGPDNIMFAIDYPYQESMEAARFMNSAPLPEPDVEKIAHGNAEKVFHIATT